RRPSMPSFSPCWTGSALATTSASPRRCCAPTISRRRAPRPRRGGSTRRSSPRRRRWPISARATSPRPVWSGWRTDASDPEEGPHAVEDAAGERALGLRRDAGRTRLAEGSVALQAARDDRRQLLGERGTALQHRAEGIGVDLVERAV